MLQHLAGSQRPCWANGNMKVQNLCLHKNHKNASKLFKRFPPIGNMECATWLDMSTFLANEMRGHKQIQRVD